MCRLGSSAFLCEVAIACMMFVGNIVFIHYLQEEGVAAFSIACYFFPIIFMVYNAIAQSAQPIISYNHGLHETARVRRAYLLALKTAVGCGAIFAFITALFSSEIVSMFIDRSYPAYEIASKGLPLYATGFIFFAINIYRILPKCGTGTLCHYHYLITWVRPTNGLLLWTSPALWQRGYLAGNSLGRVTNYPFHTYYLYKNEKGA